MADMDIPGSAYWLGRVETALADVIATVDSEGAPEPVVRAVERGRRHLAELNADYAVQADEAGDHEMAVHFRQQADRFSSRAGLAAKREAA